ncbi:excinuclease ABC subunit UvrC [Candidatus Curtissbacteria bacterium]|nr:excinuclease ABC subunit UvrC [Candidatus Curtissbacteria bacterium]
MDIKDEINTLPKSPGVYIFYNEHREIIYIGKASQVKERVLSYFKTRNLGPKTNLLVKKIAKVKSIKVFSQFEALLLEAELIKKHQPFFNIRAKDDKSPIYITITNDQIPLVATTRKSKISKSDYTKGPFPSTKATREVLRIIRRIFPYCHHRSPKKPCLYVHLGLCPYPHRSGQAKEEYPTTIKKIKQLLSGKNKQLLRQLTAEMNKFAKELKFEEAKKIKNQIEKIQFLLTTFHAPREFIEQPTLVDDQARARLADLKEQLGLSQIPTRIECFDISNISGQLATGSMVTFVAGQAEKSSYRRFRIKFTKKPDDYQMLREVLTRRFRNDWPKPDLIIVDGGRGQLNIALSTLEKFNLKIPVVSLAKRFEEIYVPHRIIPVSLPKESLARQLAQAIRDEAHRFAIKYHRLLRSKALLQR